MSLPWFYWWAVEVGRVVKSVAYLHWNKARVSETIKGMSKYHLGKKIKYLGIWVTGNREQRTQVLWARLL